MNESPGAVRVCIVEDDDDIRQAWRLLIDGTPGYMCVGAFRDCESALDDLETSDADVVLMDIQLPGMSGIEGTRRLRQRGVEADVIMLTVREDDEAVFDSLAAGACGYFPKTTPPGKVLAAIEEARRGGAPMHASVARRVVESFHRSGSSPLTERETEILRALCLGKSYKAIAASLYISQGTVHTHLKNIYKKLHVHSKTEAMARALKDRLI